MNTKKIILLGSMAFIILLCPACYEDLGNYDYHPINEVTISGIEPFYEALVAEPLTIIPTLTSTIAENEDNYSFEWIALPLSTVVDEDVPSFDTIARTRNLENYRTDLYPNIFYTVYYRVIDNTTGVAFEKKFELAVRTEVSKGYLVMNDIDGIMRLDMLSFRRDSFHYIQDVLAATGSELPQQQGPIKVVVFADRFSPGGKAVYLLTRSGANRIHAETFRYKPTYNIRYHFSTPVDNFIAENIAAGQSSAVLYGQGYLYNYNATFNYFWGPKVNTIDRGSSLFTPSPKIITHIGSETGSSVVFDEDTKSFYGLTTVYYDGCVKLYEPEGDGRRFSFTNTGKDLLYITAWGYQEGRDRFYAILKDPATNNCYLAVFTVATEATTTQPFYGMMEDADMYKAEHFAIGGDFVDRYVFYSIGSKIFQYDIGDKITREMLDFGTDKITYMEFKNFRGWTSEPYPLVGKSLTVARYNEATKEGVLELYNVPNLNAPLMRVREWKGFGKIVSLDYKW